MGLSTCRRTLNLLALRYSDDTIKCLACFICGQLRTTCAGYPPVNLNSTDPPTFANTEIAYHKGYALRDVEAQHPGTLLNNCGFDLWQKRYVDQDEERSKTYPWRGKKLVSKPLSQCVDNRERHLSRWAVQLQIEGKSWKLFGCTEDIRCLASPDRHAGDCEQTPFCRKLCRRCEVPVCRDSWGKLWKHDANSLVFDGGTEHQQ